MNRRILTACLLAAAVAAMSVPATAVLAAETACDVQTREHHRAARPNTVTVNFENDLFAGTDDEYTNGVKLSWASANLDDYLTDPCLPQILKGINHYLKFVDSGDYSARNMGLSLGQAMFTPTDRSRVSYDPTDRPYAGWLYLGFAYNSRTATAMRTFELEIGMVGPQSYAMQTQDFVHDLRGIPRFLGWANQIPDEPGLVFTYELKHRQVLVTPKHFPNIDVIPHYGATLGNVSDYLNAGAEIRAGYNLPDDFGTSAIRPGGNNSAPLATQDEPRGYAAKGVHVFASFDARAVLRNIFLDGDTFRSSPSVDKRPFVGDVALGLAWSWRHGKIAYAHYLRTKEFYGQQIAQKFGSITFSYVFL